MHACWLSWSVHHHRGRPRSSQYHPKRRYLSGRKREDVADKLARSLAGRADGLVFDAGDLTVSEYLKRWLTDSVRGSVRRSTYESYRRQVERYVVPAVGRIKLTKLAHMHVQGLYR